MREHIDHVDIETARMDLGIRTIEELR